MFSTAHDRTRYRARAPPMAPMHMIEPLIFRQLTSERSARALHRADERLSEREACIDCRGDALENCVPSHNHRLLRWQHRQCRGLGASLVTRWQRLQSLQGGAKRSRVRL